MRGEAGLNAILEDFYEDRRGRGDDDAVRNIARALADEQRERECLTAALKDAEREQVRLERVLTRIVWSVERDPDKLRDFAREALNARSATQGAEKGEK